MSLNDNFNIANLNKNEIINELKSNSEKDLINLYNYADNVRKKFLGDEVYLRGLIKISNYCSKNCFYCENREDNFNLQRYRMTEDEILKTAVNISRLGIKSIILQSGMDEYFDTERISYLTYAIKEKTNSVISLALGAKNFNDYKTWKIAGADRYSFLEGIVHGTISEETSDLSELKKAQPNQIKYLQKIGYKVGAEVIIGIPGQTMEDIANILFLLPKLNLDSVIISRYIPEGIFSSSSFTDHNLVLTYKTIALARILLKDAQISYLNQFDNIDVVKKTEGLTIGGNFLIYDFTFVGDSSVPNNFKSSISDYDITEKYSSLKKNILARGRIFSSEKQQQQKKKKSLSSF